MNNLIYWLWLGNMSGIFSNKITALLEHFDTIEDIYMADVEAFQKVQGISRADSLMLCNKDLTKAKEIYKKTQEIGATILTYDDKNYPDSLRRIDNPPYVLYLRGEILPWDRLMMLSVVGTRKCTDYGVKVTTNICSALAQRGVTIVSGMAVGIDGIAARAALETGAKTVAVLGSGLDVVYPSENAELMKAIEKNGAVISEYPPGSGPLGHHFPERNRIINGLSKGVLVTEAPMRSGALITANYALENGRDLFSVPGSIFSYYSQGTNMLIKQGAAKAVTCAMDILEEYPYEMDKLVEPVKKEDKNVNNIKSISLDDEKYKDLGDDEKKIVTLLIEDNMHIEDIKSKTGLEMAELNSILPMLEMMGIIRKLPGDNYKLEV